jgi:cyclic pyranopterin phosphate synthase
MSTNDRLPQLRVTVNARCGRACFFCRPSGEGLATHHSAELTLDELIAVAATCRAYGIRSIKLTGGDPALWPPLVEAVKRLKTEAGYTDVQIISRHPLIGALAPELNKAGADLINVSLDTLNPDLHRAITGIGDLAEIIGAIHQVVACGLPVKINMVVMAGINDDEVEDLILFCEEAGVRELKLLDTISDLDAGKESFSKRLVRLQQKSLNDLHVPLSIMLPKLRARGISMRVSNQGGLGHPMTEIKMKTGLIVTVKDHNAGAWYGSICNGCRHFPCHDALMALRLTADLRLQFCLLREDVAIDLKSIISDKTELQNVVGGALKVFGRATFNKLTAA